MAPTAFLSMEAGDAVDVFDLGFGFEVERGDAGVDAVGDFLIGFADAGVDDFFGIAAGLEGAIELAAAGDVEAAALGREELADVDVAAAFDGVADGGVDGLEGLGDLAVVVEEGGLGVDVGGRADVAGDFFGRHVFAVKLVVFVGEEVHGGWVVAGC